MDLEPLVLRMELYVSRLSSLDQALARPVLVLSHEVTAQWSGFGYFVRLPQQKSWTDRANDLTQTLRGACDTLKPVKDFVRLMVVALTYDYDSPAGLDEREQLVANLENSLPND